MPSTLLPLECLDGISLVFSGNTSAPFEVQFPACESAGVQFVGEPIKVFAERLRKQAGKNIWIMRGGKIIGSFLDEGAIDEFIITVVPTFIGDGIPLIARNRRDLPLKLLSLRQFSDSVVQFHYQVQRPKV